MSENIPFSKTSFKLAQEAMSELVARPLSKVLDTGSLNPLESILVNLEKDNYSTLAAWKKDVDTLLCKETDDDDENRILAVLKNSFDKKYNFIVQVTNCQFKTILKNVNEQIIKVAEANKGDNFSFKKLSEY